MKKQFLTLALLATAAVGGAFAANKFVDGTYKDGSGATVICEAPETLVSCEDLTLFHIEDNSPVDPSEVAGTYRQN